MSTISSAAKSRSRSGKKDTCHRTNYASVRQAAAAFLRAHDPVFAALSDAARSRHAARRTLHAQ